MIRSVYLSTGVEGRVGSGPGARFVIVSKRHLLCLLEDRQPRVPGDSSVLKRLLVKGRAWSWANPNWNREVPSW